jgi:hypothetical protein
MNKKMIFITQEENLVFFWQTFISNPPSTTVEGIPILYFYLFFALVSVVLFVDLLFSKTPTKKRRVNPSPARDSEPELPSEPPSGKVLKAQVALMLLGLRETLGTCEDSCDGSVDTNAPAIDEEEIPEEVGGTTRIKDINN